MGAAASGAESGGFHSPGSDEPLHDAGGPPFLAVSSYFGAAPRYQRLQLQEDVSPCRRVVASPDVTPVAQKSKGLFRCFGPGRGLFMEADQQVQHQVWNYVGPARGGYELMGVYDYVGEGRGSFQPQFMDASLPPPTGRCGPCGVCGGGLGPRGCLILAIVCPLFAALVCLLGVELYERRADITAFREQVRDRVLDQSIFGDARDGAVAALGQVGRSAGRWNDEDDDRDTPAGPAEARRPDADAWPGRHPLDGARRFSCQVGLKRWRRSWTRRKKDWCCRLEGVGCPKNRTPQPYDCHKDAQQWQQLWATEKKDFCCGYLRNGCSTLGVEVVGLPPTGNHGAAVSATSTTTVFADYDCAAGYERWEQGWSDLKKVWCCQHTGKGCGAATASSSTTSTTWTASTTTTSATWSTTSTTWSTTTTTLTSTTLTPTTTTRPMMPTGTTSRAPASGHCMAVCSLYGRSATCAARVTWVAVHRFPDATPPTACSRGYKVVQDECDVCRACSREEATAACLDSPSFATGTGPSKDTPAFDCDLGRDTWMTSWSEAKILWCKALHPDLTIVRRASVGLRL